MNMVFAKPEQETLYNLCQSGKVEPRSMTFALSISSARHPTANQLFYVNKLIQDANNAPTQAVVVPTMIFNFIKIKAMFDNARQHLKRPKITLLLTPNDKYSQKVRFGLSGDTLYMSVGGYGTLQYGSINLMTNEIYLKRHGHEVKPDLFALLKQFSEEPEMTAVAHGKLTGCCCFCSLPLSDARSLHQGYGPICAAHYHIPWGDESNLRPITSWVMNQ